MKRENSNRSKRKEKREIPRVGKLPHASPTPIAHVGPPQPIGMPRALALPGGTRQSDTACAHRHQRTDM
jgi:hypothetical protein